jgi:hypothetical protein
MALLRISLRNVKLFGMGSCILVLWTSLRFGCVHMKTNQQLFQPRASQGYRQNISYQIQSVCGEKLTKLEPIHFNL